MKREDSLPWFEKNGRIQTTIKTIGLYNYSTPEICKSVILQKTGEQPERAVLLYETDRREAKIKVVLVYLPLLIILALGSYLISLCIISSNVLLLKVSLLLTFSLLIAYRVTFFVEYLESRKSLFMQKKSC